jgi:hypothetical protein
MHQLAHLACFFLSAALGLQLIAGICAFRRALLKEKIMAQSYAIGYMTGH